MPTTTITDVRTIGVTVTNQDDAIAFDVDNLGFDVQLDPDHSDYAMDCGCPRGATTSIALIAGQPGRAGRGHRHSLHGARRRHRARGNE